MILNTFLSQDKIIKSSWQIDCLVLDSATSEILAWLDDSAYSLQTTILSPSWLFKYHKLCKWVRRITKSSMNLGGGQIKNQINTLCVNIMFIIIIIQSWSLLTIMTGEHVITRLKDIPHKQCNSPQFKTKKHLQYQHKPYSLQIMNYLIFSSDIT